MKKLFLVTPLIFIISFGYGQETSDKAYSKSIGLDATFINNLLPLDNPIGRGSVYDVFLRYYKENNKFNRFSAAININYNLSNSDDEFRNTSTNLGTNFRYGSGTIKPFWDKFEFFYGLDLIGGYNYNGHTFEIENVDTKNTNRVHTTQLGFGPFVGIQYKFSDRFFISTEATHYLSGRYSISTVKNSGSDDPTTDRAFQLFSNLTLPNTLVIHYKF